MPIPHSCPHSRTDRPAGWSIHMMLALVFHEKGLLTVPVPSLLTEQGPFSAKSARIDEQPGPPAASAEPVNELQWVETSIVHSCSCSNLSAR